MAEDNLSAVLRKKGDLCLENRPIPTLGPNEVLIAVHAVGICGSDIHYWKRGCIGDFVVKSPMVLGHETSGVVIKVNEDVTNLKPGDRVSIEPGIPCRMCDFCKGGRYNLCLDMKFCATPPIDGTLCRYYKHPADFCYKLPENVSLEEGALLEPLSVAVHACKRAGVTAGLAVLICGAGPIGLVNLLTSKALGASQVCITDICESRLQVAKKLGANHQILVKNKSDSEIIEEIKTKMGQLPDISIECSGAESSIRVSVLVTKSGGCIVLVGLGPAEIKMPIVNAAVREVDIRGVFRYANCYPTALDLVASGAVNLKSLITHNFKLEDVLNAFETAHTDVENAIKVVIHCNK